MTFGGTSLTDYSALYGVSYPSALIEYETTLDQTGQFTLELSVVDPYCANQEVSIVL